MSDFMEWAEGDDFITEDTDVRDSCESAWDAAWAQQGHRIAELKKAAKAVVERCHGLEGYPTGCDLQLLIGALAALLLESSDG